MTDFFFMPSSVNDFEKIVKKLVDNFFAKIYTWKMLTPDDPRYYDPSFDDDTEEEEEESDESDR